MAQEGAGTTQSHTPEPGLRPPAIDLPCFPDETDDEHPPRCSPNFAELSCRDRMPNALVCARSVGMRLLEVERASSTYVTKTEAPV